VILDRSVKSETRKRAKADPANNKEVGAPIPAMVSSVTATVGQKVKAKEKLCVLEAMKMQTTVYALTDGVVDRIEVQAGDQVDSKDLLVRLR
jgi:pyruvate carboxylase